MAKKEKRKVTTYTAEQKEQALSLLRVLSLNEVAAKLGIPKTTIKTWSSRIERGEAVVRADETPTGVEQNALEQARQAKAAQFVESTWSLAESALAQLNARVKRANETLDEVEELKNFILANRETVLSGADLDRYPKGAVVELLDKLKKMEYIKIGELSTVFGVAYDKFALASGKATSRVEVGFEDYAE